VLVYITCLSAKNWAFAVRHCFYYYVMLVSIYFSPVVLNREPLAPLGGHRTLSRWPRDILCKMTAFFSLETHLIYTKFVPQAKDFFFFFWRHAFLGRKVGRFSLEKVSSGERHFFLESRLFGTKSSKIFVGEKLSSGERSFFWRHIYFSGECRENSSLSSQFLHFLIKLANQKALYHLTS